MKYAALKHGAVLLAAGLLLAAAAEAQFRDEFNGPILPLDPSGENGWAFFTGDGTAVMDFRQAAGYASIFVDASQDTRNVWWALIKRRVSQDLDLRRLAEPGYELRISARVRVSRAPRRINLHLNTQKTTDFHSHLMEFDIPDAEVWTSVSMTTRNFEAVPGDTVSCQLALMDWGLGKYRADVDDFRVDVVNVPTAGPDDGVAVPYHPLVPDPKTFTHALPAARDATVDIGFPQMNFESWSIRDGAGTTRMLSVGGTQLAVLRWDFKDLAGKKASGAGLLELTTQAVEGPAAKLKDSGEIRIVEILGGDAAWDRKTVTWMSFLQGRESDDVLNSQMIIDGEARPGRGEKTYFTISRPVLQRLIDGRTLGLAVRPLGAIHASFFARDDAVGLSGARLLFDLEK